MSDPRIEIPARAPASTSADDTILPFQVEALDLRAAVWDEFQAELSAGVPSGVQRSVA